MTQVGCGLHCTLSRRIIEHLDDRVVSPQICTGVVHWFDGVEGGTSTFCLLLFDLIMLYIKSVGCIDEEKFCKENRCNRAFFMASNKKA